MNWVRLGRQAVWGFAWVFLGTFMMPLVRPRPRGRHNIPRRGAGLLVGNHVTFFDPVTVSWPTLRRIHGVGTSTMLRVPIFGRMLPWLSAIPFNKGLKDRGAMEEIQRRIDEDAIVLIFPEGDRSWTGRMMPVGDGIGRLAIRLGVPVLFCRQTTGHLQWPRWARYPRVVPLEMEFLPPVMYSEDMCPAEVTADIVARVQIDPEEHLASRWSWGFRLADGLPAFLWACPDCFSKGGLRLAPGSRGNAVECTACGRRWQIDLSCRMIPTHDGPVRTIDAAMEAVVQHFGPAPVACPTRHAEDGTLLEGEAELVVVTRGVRKTDSLGRGTLMLRADGLVFSSDGQERHIAFSTVKVVLVQVGDQLQVITHEVAYGVHPAHQSLQLWKYFLDRHLAAARSRP